MTVDVRPMQDYEADMAALAAASRMDTHIVVARGPYGETRSEHARPYREAQMRAAEWRRQVGGEWTVSVEPVSGWTR